MKKIWICGASGMLGSHLSALCQKLKLSFIGNDRKQVDITNLENVLDFVRTQNITHIINCAAYTNVDKAESEPNEAYRINAMGPHHLGVAGRRYRAHVLHFSTDYVFDGKQQLPYSEEDVCSPQGAYGMSKLAGEIKLLDEHEDACIIRTSWLFGLYGKNFVETILRLLAEREEIKVVTDQVGRPTYCQDLAEISLRLLDADGIFHFANSNETNWYQYALEIHAQANQCGLSIKTKKIQPILTEEYPTFTKRPAYSSLSTQKIEKFLGFATRSWQVALQDYFINIKNTKPM